MQLTPVFLLGLCLNVAANGLAQTMTFSGKDVPLEKVFTAVKQQTGYLVSYKVNQIRGTKPVTINAKEVPLEIFLQRVLKDQALEFTIEVNTIFIKRKEGESSVEASPLIPVPNLAFINIKIKGKVTNEKGEPLVGVTVAVKGTNRGTTTDGEGKFQLSIDSDRDAELEFSIIGYQLKTVKTANQTEFNITMVELVSKLNDVVVVAYGTQKKSSVTAAVSTLKGKDIASTPVSNLGNSLGGRVPGVILRQNNGEPGNDGSDIYIRGISSTGANQPLLIVDGIPRDFKQLDPNTIESFTVLKDAAAVAPYGVAAANGVILVTTKSGKSGAPSVTYNGYVGFQNPTVFPDYVSGYQYGVLQNAAAKNAGLPLPYSDFALQKLKDGSDPDAYPNPDVYKDIIKKNAILTNHNIEVSGGTDKVKYYGSFSHQIQQGMWPATNNKKYNLNLNLSAQVTNTTKITFGVNGRVQNANYPSITTGRLFELIGYTHTSNGPLYFSNGVPGTYITSSLLNSGYNKINTTALYSQLSIDQDLSFIPGLKARVTVAYDPTIVLNKLWRIPIHKGSVDTTKHPYVITDGIFEQTKASLNESTSLAHQLTYQGSLSYARVFGKSNVSALALFEAKDNSALSLAASRRNYNLSIDEISMGSSSAADMTTSGTSSKARQLGLVYRVTYDYSNKYLFEASGRYDGSYYFAPGHRFGFFPAFSVGWRLSEENFMKGISWVNNLKIRGSYGEVGALAGSAFQYLSTFGVYGPAYVIGGQAVQATLERNENNPNITWERAKKSDVGIEATLWGGWLTIEADYFHEKRSNMLVNPDVIVPAEYGIGLSQVNAGVMQNQGIDLSLSSSYNVSKDLQVSLSGNFTYAKNTLLKVFETATTYNNPNRRVTGKALGTQFGYHALGFFQVDDFKGTGELKEGIATQPWGAVQPGDIRYEDLNGDGKINDNDLTKIGDPIVPQILFGITPSVRYKAFSIDVLFQGAAKTNLYLDRQNAWAFHNGMSALVENMNYWTPENPNALNPRITSGPTTNNTQTSSFWMKSGGYVRVKSATLSYTIPTTISKKIGSQNARAYVSGQNVFTWTKLKNFDPESTSPYSNLYPQQKVVSVGVNITF
ncbi:TonB-dependent receptor [Chitinophaga sp. MM2321]|uniref:TonB-dependent receptor n=1 Tax=Chitinophaga sp. MM2321 TaxID=3137178 RepID=UPI0032D57BEF